MKKIIPIIISFLTWIVALIIDTVIELQDSALADSLNGIFSGVGFNKVTIMGIQFSQLDDSHGVGLHFFVVLILFLLVGAIIAYRKEISGILKNSSNK